MISDDPTQSNPEFYRLLWENDFVRVLEYSDSPGDRTTPHMHPNSVMVTLSAFERRLSARGHSIDVALPAGHAVWLDAQRHSGENIGGSPTRSILIELKGASAGVPAEGTLGPEHDL
ncbi:cytoplasmic protein [Agromyces atrinae]|uniref:cytoplasmic protein n=1 Tax=Agromyces atrinae TaxID=592376 RepID=UPI001F57E372|nr:cytoplasmic protein [Agromyces atrinae]MCI2957545.1 cytoplasmic protein [Agromyces atrinae]